jgi:hypothetical protein
MRPGHGVCIAPGRHRARQTASADPFRRGLGSARRAACLLRLQGNTEPEHVKDSRRSCLRSNLAPQGQRASIPSCRAAVMRNSASDGDRSVGTQGCRTGNTKPTCSQLPGELGVIGAHEIVVAIHQVARGRDVESAQDVEQRRFLAADGPSSTTISPANRSRPTPRRACTAEAPVQSGHAGYHHRR